MHRIDTSTAQVDKFGAGKNGFTGGNPQTGELPTALDADFFDSVQEEIASLIEAAGISLSKASNNQLLSAVRGLVGPGRLLNVQTFKSSGVYTPTSGTKKIRVRLVGGGGAGGGTAATASNQIASSFGGGAGAYGDTGMIDASAITTVQVTVGTAGASTSAGNGGNGGASSFGSYIAAPGGYGGIFGAPGSAGTTGSDMQTSEACTGSNVLISVPGKGGAAPFNITTTGAGVKAGAGGASMFSAGGRAFNGLISSAESAKGYGGGGSGIAAGTGAVAFAGGNGSSGLVIVEEYA